jgi:uncharacterized protein YoxC
MADSVLGRLKVIIGADITQLQAGLRKAQDTIKSSVAGFAQAAGIGIGLSAAAFATLAQGALRFADDLVETADAIGLNVERFQELRFAATQSGISVDQFTTGMQKLATEAGKAGITTERAFDLVVRKMSEAAKQTERVAIAREAFGRGGAQFALAFGQGADAVERFARQAREAGAVLGEDVARSLAEANDKLQSFADFLKVNVANAVHVVQPILEGLAATMGALSDKIAGFTAQTIQQTDINRMKNLIDQVVEFERSGQITGFGNEGILTGEAAAKRYAENLREIARLQQLIQSTDLTRPPLPGRQPGATTGGAAATQDERAFFDSLNRRTEATRKQSAADREAAAAAKKLADEAKGLYDATRTPLEQLNQEWTRLDDLLSQGAIDWDTYARAVLDASAAHTEIAQTTREASDLGADLGLTFSSAFEDAIAGGREFSEVLRGLASDLLRLTTRTLITQPLANAFAGFDLSGLLSGLLPGRASGGSVYPGQAYVVGERGPEILVPGSAGRVLTGAGGVTVNIVESPGSGGQVQRSTRGGQTVVDVMVERVRGAIAGDIMRGSGPVAAAIERTYGAARAAGAF